MHALSSNAFTRQFKIDGLLVGRLSRIWPFNQRLDGASARSPTRREMAMSVLNDPLGRYELSPIGVEPDELAEDLANA